MSQNTSKVTDTNYKQLEPEHKPDSEPKLQKLKQFTTENQLQLTSNETKNDIIHANVHFKHKTQKTTLYQLVPLAPKLNLPLFEDFLQINYPLRNQQFTNSNLSQEEITANSKQNYYNSRMLRTLPVHPYAQKSISCKCDFKC